MYPYLFHIGDAALHSYTFLMGISFFVGLGLVLFQFKKSPIPLETEFLVTHSLLSWVAGLVGARVLFVLVEWKKFGTGYFSTFRPWQGGIVFLGGLAAGVVYWIFLFKKRKFPLRLGFSLLAPGLAMAHAVGRIGCFLNGCCFGKSCPIDSKLNFAVTFTDPNSAAPLNTPLYPIQIFEAVILASISIYLVFINSRRLKKGFTTNNALAFDGLSVYLLSYGISRFFLEFYRGDLYRGFWGPFSTSQWLSLGMILMGTAFVFRPKFFNP
jgi:phosphatidylglycerol:prolipoprotein diacylglycerol transferase